MVRLAPGVILGIFCSIAAPFSVNPCGVPLAGPSVESCFASCAAFCFGSGIGTSGAARFTAVAPPAAPAAPACGSDAEPACESCRALGAGLCCLFSQPRPALEHSVPDSLGRVLLLACGSAAGTPRSAPPPAPIQQTSGNRNFLVSAASLLSPVSTRSSTPQAQSQSLASDSHSPLVRSPLAPSLPVPFESQSAGSAPGVP